jgi:hypothetical protein
MIYAYASESAPGRRVRDDIQGAILDAVKDDTVLIGSLASLAHGLDTSVRTFRVCLRALLMAEQIVVETEPRGQLVIRRKGPSF